MEDWKDGGTSATLLTFQSSNPVTDLAFVLV